MGNNYILSVFQVAIVAGIGWGLSVQAAPEKSPPPKKIAAVRLVANCAQVLSAKTAFELQNILTVGDARQKNLAEAKSRLVKAYGSNSPIVHSFEKEGLYYEEIEKWFSLLKPEAKDKLNKLFKKEMRTYKASMASENSLVRWLSEIDKLTGQGGSERKLMTDVAQQWPEMNVTARFNFLMSLNDTFAALPLKFKVRLFENDILSFDDVTRGPEAPELVTVGDDLGSYEVRLSRGTGDRALYLQLRDQTEEYLDGRVGHTHLFHDWPDDAQARAKMAGRYVELLDSATWYLFWRQMHRSPNEVESVMAHPFLGVYTRASLERLHLSIVSDDPKTFKNKYRMVGARAFPASPDIPEQGQGMVPDWELRSGNKNAQRDFISTMLEARLGSGDYSGLRDFRELNFNPSADISEIAAPFLDASQIAILKKFELVHPAIKHSSHALAHNHVRNRVIAPVLPWDQRLSMPLKQEKLKKEQKKYADGLVQIAQRYLHQLAAYKGMKQKLNKVELGDLRAETVESLELLMYAFARQMRLDVDFENYLEPYPTQPIALDVPVTGPIDVNAIPIGLEYSHRFLPGSEPLSRKQADSAIKKFAEKLRQFFGSKEEVDANGGDGHGHGIVVRYKVKDQQNQTWRVEWDGISRYYVDGQVRRAWGGHIEVPSPRFTPHSTADGISQMFAASRAMGMAPSRAAGGGHFNVDLENLMAQVSPEVGTQAIANMIKYFESNQELIMFMWTHPLRMHAAQPVELNGFFKPQMNNFKGSSWEGFGRMLYRLRYFNTIVGRKPKYAPLNVTAIMTPILPEVYKPGLDIRNSKEKWQPSFGKVTGRIEARFFDAPENEFTAALQVIYFRALINHCWNSKTPFTFAKKYTAEDYERWKSNPDEWLDEASEHLRELGLDPAMFEGLLWNSYNNRMRHEIRVKPREIFRDYLPITQLNGKFAGSEQPRAA